MLPLAQMIPRIFRQAWRRYGQPQLAVVKPISAWALPAGYAYDPTADVIRNGSGYILEGLEAYWDITYIPTVPASPASDARVLIAAGIIAAGTLEMLVLAADAPTVRSAHAVEVDGVWYTVKDVSHAAAGNGGEWARVTLTRRGGV